MEPSRRRERRLGISGDKEYKKQFKPRDSRSLLFVSSSSALSKIIKAGYAVLQLEYFFTAGPDEVRAWTIRVRAPSAHVCWKHTCKQTHTHSIPRSTLLAPSLISHFQLCHGCALASHYRPRITSITAELLNGESGGLH